MLYFHPVLGISVCLAESWIIKDKHIFNGCVAMYWGCYWSSSVLCGLGLAWIKQPGLKVKGRKLYSEKRATEGLFNQSLSKPSSQGCCLLPEGAEEVGKLCSSC